MRPNLTQFNHEPCRTKDVNRFKVASETPSFRRSRSDCGLYTPRQEMVAVVTTTSDGPSARPNRRRTQSKNLSSSRYLATLSPWARSSGGFEATICGSITAMVSPLTATRSGLRSPPGSRKCGSSRFRVLDTRPCIVHSQQRYDRDPWKYASSSVSC